MSEPSTLPTKSEKPARPVRQHIIDVANRLFYAQGIRAVGIDEVIRTADVGKATLYRNFASKHELVLAYLEQRSSFARARLLESRREAPWDSIISAFEALQTNLENPGFRGCAFLLAVSEHGESAEIRGLAGAHKSFVRDYFTDLSREAGLPDGKGAQLALIYEGALATAVVTPESGPGDVALSVVRALLAKAADQ